MKQSSKSPSVCSSYLYSYQGQKRPRVAKNTSTRFTTSRPYSRSPWDQVEYSVLKRWFRFCLDRAANSTGTVWIQTGLSRDDPKYGREGLYKYIEWNYPGVYSIVDKGDAKAGTIQGCNHEGKGWSMDSLIGGSALGKNVKPSGMNTTEFTGESYRSGKGTCQLMDVNFSSSTWKTSAMEKHLDKPYSIKSPGSNSWRAVGS